MQITSSPAVFAVSINHNNYTNKCISKLGKFAVNVLGENCDPLLIGVFGFRSGKDFGKFDGRDYLLRDYLPIIGESAAYITCKVTDTAETSTHTIFIGEVTDADILNHADEPMTYAHYHKVVKGKTPKNAPTYIKE